MNLAQQTLDRAPTNASPNATPQVRRSRTLPAALDALRARSAQRRTAREQDRATDLQLERAARRDHERAARRARSREFAAFPATRSASMAVLPPLR